MTSESLVLQQSALIGPGYVMQVILSLGIVIAIIFVMAKYLLPRLKLSTPGKLIQVIDRVFLEPQVSAYILKVGKKAWLVVAGSKSVANISEIDLESLPK